MAKGVRRRRSGKKKKKERQPTFGHLCLGRRAIPVLIPSQFRVSK